MSMGDYPLAYFLTWTTYGSHLQGDPRWWRHRNLGERRPEPALARWHRNRLNHSAVLLSVQQRCLVEREALRLSQFRNWRLWAVAARSNHVHVVVSAKEHRGEQVRDQLKANCTRALRASGSEFQGRPVWSVGGDLKLIGSEEALQQVTAYVAEAQDRKGQDSAR